MNKKEQKLRGGSVEVLVLNLVKLPHEYVLSHCISPIVTVSVGGWLTTLRKKIIP